MKTICKLDEPVRRVTNEQAKELVKQGWKYCPKQLYKNQQKIDKFMKQ